MTEITWFVYGAFCGYIFHPLLIAIKAIIREAKIAKQEWRKDGRTE